MQRAAMSPNLYGNDIRRLANLALASFFETVSIISFNGPDHEIC
jgi:hypothetical protein